MSRNIAFALFFGFLSATALYSQKIAYLESHKILDQMPGYNQAVKEIEQQKDIWQKEMIEKFNGVETLYQNYISNENLLSEDIKKMRQEEIFEAEREAKEFKEEKFGIEGDLHKLQEEKIKPLQDKIFEAARMVAEETGYDFVFDKTPETSWVYINPEHDITLLVFEKTNK